MQHIEDVVLSVTSMVCSCFKTIENFESDVGIRTGGMEILKKNNQSFTSFAVTVHMSFQCNEVQKLT